jgi:hypothetical protein
LEGFAVKVTPEKLAGMKAVSDKRSMIATATMDQRGAQDKVGPNSGTGATKRTKPSEQFATKASDWLFALLFLSAMTMIFVLLIVSSAMSWYSHDKELLSRQTDALLAMAKYGFAAIIGLLVRWKLHK